MIKDKRHKTVRILIEGGHITDFSYIFDHIPKTAVANDLGIHFTRMDKMVKNVGEIKVNDIFLFAGYFEIDAKLLFELIYTQRTAKKSSPLRKK